MSRGSEPAVACTVNCNIPHDGSTVDGSPSYWGYDQAAQAGVDLAAGESATPLPHYVYGTGTAAQDAQWANWYFGSLADWIHWYVRLLRDDGWTGPTYVLHPSYGERTNWSPKSPSYELQLALGTDPGLDMDAYDTVSNVWPWCTWADDPEPYWRAGDTVDSDMAAWRNLLVLATQRGLAAHIMGENTGGGGSAAIQRLASGPVASGYAGIFYLDYPSLFQRPDGRPDLGSRRGFCVSQARFERKQRRQTMHRTEVNARMNYGWLRLLARPNLEPSVVIRWIGYLRGGTDA